MKKLNKRVWKRAWKCFGYPDEYGHIFTMNGKKKQRVTVVITDTPQRPKSTKDCKGFQEIGVVREIDKMVNRAIKRLNKFAFYEELIED